MRFSLSIEKKGFSRLKDSQTGASIIIKDDGGDDLDMFVNVINGLDDLYNDSLDEDKRLCNIIGDWVEHGEYPCHEASLQKIVEGISYKNAVRYFHI